MVICLERDAGLHMAQLMPLPLTVSCFSKIQIGFTFLVPSHPGGPGKGPLKGGVFLFSVFFVLIFLFLCFVLMLGIRWNQFVRSDEVRRIT